VWNWYTFSLRIYQSNTYHTLPDRVSLCSNTCNENTNSIKHVKYLFVFLCQKALEFFFCSFWIILSHTNLSPIRRGFKPGFVNYTKGCTRLAAASDKAYQLLAHGRWFSPGTVHFSAISWRVKVKFNKRFRSLDTTGAWTRDLLHIKASILTITPLIRFVWKVGSDNNKDNYFVNYGLGVKTLINNHSSFTLESRSRVLTTTNLQNCFFEFTREATHPCASVFSE
jgi:hypothetical protein